MTTKPNQKLKQEIKWVLQKNLTSEELLKELEKNIVIDGASYEEILVIPFSDDINYIKKAEEAIVFYGSTTLMLNAYKSKKLSEGVFYNKESFQMKNYIDKWKEKVLNYDGIITTIEEFLSAPYSNDSTLFVRPNEDTKSFSGTVVKYSEFKELVIRFVNKNPHINSNSLILVCEPKNIEKEWRNFIVGGKVVSSSRYCINRKLNIDVTDIPSEMIKFCEECCIDYMPHDIFVMDIGLYQGKYYIIECNCFNGTGFYKHNIKTIINSVNNFLREKNSIQLN